MNSGVIFFDIGHTLATGAEQSPRRLLANRLGLNEKETRLVGRLIMTHPATEPVSLVSAMAEILPDKDYSQVRSIVENLWKEQIDCVREVPGATALLGALKVEGFRLGVISNTWHPFFLGFTEICREIKSLLDFTVLSYRIGIKKPSLDLYRHAVKITGEPAERCWMVGDTYEMDMEPAQSIGMRSIWVLRRPEIERSVLVQMLRGDKRVPDWVTGDIEEILPFMKRFHVQD
ncbi:MAG: HAD family hydrolase [Syntrophobacteraceae bacterium]